MDRLWAPWRMSYVRADGKPAGDFIAAADGAGDDRSHLVVCRTDLSIVMLNRFPYNNGHLLVAPRRAVIELEHMTDAELLDAQRVMCRMMTALRTFMRPDGFNVGLNLGRPAGAGLPEHLHWHLVPRWSGDVNFMTVVGDARVIVQALDELWLQLRAALGMPEV